MNSLSTITIETVISVLKKLRNKFEKKIYRQLNRAKCVFTYESERIPYVLSGHYTPDFVITTPLGVVYVEAKGYFRPEHKRKMVAVKRQHPGKDIRILFYSSNKKYEKWAIKNGFRYAFDKIPPDWLKGL